MKKIAVLTATRAEYGLLYWTIKAIEEDPDLELRLIVTGAHLSPEYGYTVREIEAQGIPVAERIHMLLSSDSRQGAAKSMGLLVIGLAQAFERLKPDMLLLLGDRYEILAAASVAVVMNIPIAHLCGGESTEGAIDEQVRHAVTKMAHIHLVQTEYYGQQVLKMGEEEWRVHNVGFLGGENARRLNLLTRDELERELKLKAGRKNFVVTYHPVTLEKIPLELQVDNLLAALSRFDAQIIFTYPNADSGGRFIIEKLKEFSEKRPDVHIYCSLGQLRYLSLLKHADLMVGNSSSGLLESQFFNLPTVNIGTRQKGRLRGENVIDVSYDTEDIVRGIEKAMDDNFRKALGGSGPADWDTPPSGKIVKVIKEALKKDGLLNKRLSFT